MWYPVQLKWKDVKILFKCWLVNCELCGENTAWNCWINRHFLYHVLKLFHSQDSLVGGVLVADVCDPLTLVVLSKPDTDGALLVSVELFDLLGSLQRPDLKEKFTPLFSEHEVEEEVTGNTFPGLDFVSKRYHNPTLRKEVATSTLVVLNFPFFTVLPLHQLFVRVCIL